MQQICQSAESGLQSLILFSLEQTQTNKLEQEKCFYTEYADLLGQADLNQIYLFIFNIVVIFLIQRVLEMLALFPDFDDCFF